MGPKWALLGASWAMLRHFGALREAPGRHLEAKAGLGSLDLELTCGKKATCQKLQKTIEKQRLFNDFWRQEGQESMPRWLFGGLVVVLKFILHVSGAMSWSTGLPKANIIPSWAHLGPILDLCWSILGPSWAQDGSSWARLGPCCGILEPSGRLREGILRPKQGLEALTWSLHVARRLHVNNFKQQCKNQGFQ